LFAHRNRCAAGPRETATRRSFACETDLAERLIHPDFVNHEVGLPPCVSATHKPFAFKHVHLLRLADDGRAREHSAVRDDLRMAMQFGSVPPQPSDRPWGPTDEASLSQ
jgi:hypothetical protein